MNMQENMILGKNNYSFYYFYYSLTHCKILFMQLVSLCTGSLHLNNLVFIQKVYLTKNYVYIYNSFSASIFLT